MEKVITENPSIQVDIETEADYPKTFWDKLKWLGPSLVLCSIAIGSGETIIAPYFAAKYGLSLLWIPIFAALCKGFITERIARYTLATGKSFVTGLSELPGPKGWAVWITFIPFIFLGFFLAVGWPLGVGTAIYASLTRLGFELPGDLIVKAGAFLTIVSSCYICLKGKYSGVEYACKILVGVLVICVLLSAMMLFPPIQVFLTNALPTRFFTYDGPQIGELARAIGYSGGGVMAISAYSYWVLQKGYHKKAARSTDDFKKWSKIYSLDLLTAYTIQPFVAICILICAGTMLPSLNLVPSGINIVLTTAEMLTTLGTWAYWVWLLGAAAILFSTTIAVFDGWSRALADAVVTVVPFAKSYSREQIWRYLVLLFTTGGILFAVIGIATPATFVGWGSIIEGILFYPIFGLLATYLVATKVPKERRGNSIISVMAVIGSLLFGYVGVCWLLFG